MTNDIRRLSRTGFPGNNEAETMTKALGYGDGNFIIGRESILVRYYESSCGLVTSTFWPCPQQ